MKKHYFLHFCYLFLNMLKTFNVFLTLFYLLYSVVSHLSRQSFFMPLTVSRMDRLFWIILFILRNAGLQVAKNLTLLQHLFFLLSENFSLCYPAVSQVASVFWKYFIRDYIIVTDSSNSKYYTLTYIKKDFF